jgi:hypothetical protein
MAQTFYHTFERASGRKIEVAYKARCNSASTEVEIEKAWDDETQKPVDLTTHEREDYEAFIAERHLNWI